MRCHTDHGNTVISVVPSWASSGLHSTLPCPATHRAWFSSGPQGLGGLIVYRKKGYGLTISWHDTAGNTPTCQDEPATDPRGMPQKGTHPPMSKAAKAGYTWVALSRAEWVRGGWEAGSRPRDGPAPPGYLRTVTAPQAGLQASRKHWASCSLPPSSV